MPRYVVLVRFSDEGMRTIKDGPARLAQARETLRSQGAEMKDFYLTLGEYDAIAVIDAPDDETIARTALTIGAGGASRSQTLRSQGAELKDFYLTLGEYDAVAVVEAPDDQTVARTSLAIGARGTSRSQTLRAFSEEEYRKIVESIP